MSSHPIWLVSLKEEMSPQTETEGRACEDAGRRQPSRNQGESNASISDCQPPELWENKFLLFKPLSLWYFAMGAPAN